MSRVLKLFTGIIGLFLLLITMAQGCELLDGSPCTADTAAALAPRVCELDNLEGCIDRRRLAIPLLREPQECRDLNLRAQEGIMLNLDLWKRTGQANAWIGQEIVALQAEYARCVKKAAIEQHLPGGSQ
jgi:hypothetical protein